MSKLGCTCGNVIVDQTDFLPYKAFLREDENSEKPIEMLAGILADYMAAQAAGTVREFLISFLTEYRVYRSTEVAAFHVDRFIKLDDPPEVLFRIIHPLWSTYDRAIYECEECGRLWIEIDPTHYVPYVPETTTRGVLQSRHHHPPYPHAGDMQ